MVAVLALAAGCAHAPVAHDEQRRVKLAVLPVDAEPFPRVASALNTRLREVRVVGVDDYFLSKVTLEVVQLSIECVEPSAACYSAVGRSLAVQELLIAQVAPAANKRGVRVTLTRFDVARSSATNVVDASYRNEDEALKKLDELLQRATSSPAPSAQGAPGSS